MQLNDPIGQNLKEQVTLLSGHYDIATMRLLSRAEASRLIIDPQLGAETNEVMQKLAMLCIAKGCAHIENYSAKSAQMAFLYVSHPTTIHGMPTAEETAEVLALATSCVAVINTFCTHVIATPTVGELDANQCAAFMAELAKMSTKVREMSTREMRRLEFDLRHRRERMQAQRQLHPERAVDLDALLASIDSAIEKITNALAD